MTYESQARALSEGLGLDKPVVAMSFVAEDADGIDQFSREVPSSCTFWTEAQQNLFYAPASAHFNCPVGALTMGLDMPDDVMETLGQFVSMMTGSNYLEEEEAAKLPAVDKDSAGIVYGPLDRFPLEPDAVLLWMNARGLMIFSEAGASNKWNRDGATALLGRPGCTAIPVAVGGQTAVSAGCAGMRTFTGVGDEDMLGVIAGGVLDDVVAALEATKSANASMQEFYSGHAASF